MKVPSTSRENKTDIDPELYDWLNRRYLDGQQDKKVVGDKKEVVGGKPSNKRGAPSSGRGAKRSKR